MPHCRRTNSRPWMCLVDRREVTTDRCRIAATRPKCGPLHLHGRNGHCHHSDSDHYADRRDRESSSSVVNPELFAGSISSIPYVGWTSNLSLSIGSAAGFTVIFCCKRQ